MSNSKKVIGFGNWDKQRWTFFNPGEFVCTCERCENDMNNGKNGKLKMDEDFLNFLESVRRKFNNPIIINSGYRCKEHPEEQKRKADKKPRGPHFHGVAADVRPGTPNTSKFNKLLSCAFECGKEQGLSLGVGVSCKSKKMSNRFIHLDIMPSKRNAPRPALWSY